MKISLVSDLHLDVSGFLDLPGGDVLILAGDVCEVKELIKEFHSTKLTDRTPGGFPCHDFFEFTIPKYKKVFMVMGNHEHYRGRFDKTYNELKSILPENVTLLEDECVEYKGVVFLGATLWTDLNRGDPITVNTIRHFMNDYKVVQNFYPAKNLYHKLTPEHTAEVHRKTKQYFKIILEQNRNKPVVVVTHMAPSFQSVNEKYKHDFNTNGGYASEMSEFILDYENIKVWVHGHMHDPVDYMIGDTRVLCNPRGYIPWEAGNGFDPAFTFEVDNGNN
jgi:Icc-related predicted phosphoesterase